MNPSKTGLLQDNRSSEQREFDIKFSDLYGSALPQPPVYLVGKPDDSKYKIFPWENQMYENSCVPHSKVLNNSIYKTLKGGQPFVLGSPAFVYRLRANYPNAGTAPADANMILSTIGVPNYADCPDFQTEDEANALVITPQLRGLARLNMAGNWATANNPSDIDQIAFASNTLGVAVSILIFAQEDEWSMESPQILYPNLTIDQAVVNHCITVLPNVSYKDSSGKRYVIIQDSAFFGGKVYRFISEDFIAARCVGADIITTLGMSSIITLPKYTFSNDLAFGSTGKDVQMLQTCLQSLGFFPTIVNGGLLTPTQFYGGLTKQAVATFQGAYMEEILTPLGLNAPTGNFGPSTRSFLNSLINK